MAILLDFAKIREDTQEVEYVFGYPTMDRHLVIQKASSTGRPLDGNPDRNYTAVFVKVVRQYQRTLTWPEKGTYAA